MILLGSIGLSLVCGIVVLHQESAAFKARWVQEVGRQACLTVRFRGDLLCKQACGPTSGYG